MCCTLEGEMSEIRIVKRPEVMHQIRNDSRFVDVGRGHLDHGKVELGLRSGLFLVRLFQFGKPRSTPTLDLRVQSLPRQPGSRLSGSHQRPRPAPRHANRGREVALLPTPCYCVGRNSPGYLASHRVNGRPGRETRGTRSPCRAHPLRTRSRHLAPGLPRLPSWRT